MPAYVRLVDVTHALRTQSSLQDHDIYAEAADFLEFMTLPDMTSNVIERAAAVIYASSVPSAVAWDAVSPDERALFLETAHDVLMAAFGDEGSSRRGSA